MCATKIRRCGFSTVNHWLHGGTRMTTYVCPFVFLAVPTNVVNALVNNVTNPGNGGTCRRFDITNFQVSFNGNPGRDKTSSELIFINKAIALIFKLRCCNIT